MSQNTNTIYNNLQLIDPADTSLKTNITEKNVKFENSSTSNPNRPLESFMNSNGGIGGYLSVLSRNLAPTTLDPFSWYFKINDASNLSYLELGGAYENPADDPAYYNNRIKHNEILMASDQVGEGGLLRLVYNARSTGSGLFHDDSGGGGFTIEEGGGNLDIKTLGGYDITVQSSNQINLNSNDNVNINCGVNLIATCSDNIIMTANNDSISFTADDNITLLSNGLGNVNLDAPNVNSYTYSIPICFDFIEIDRNYNYTVGSQQWEQMWQQSLNIPPQFFVESPQSGYTSTRWKIDFTMNTWSTGGTNGSDKALAFYMDFLDQNSNTYTTLIFDKNKPFCNWYNTSTWSQGGSISQLSPHVWSDYIDFQPIVGTGSGNLPLKFNLYISADNPRQFDFSYQLCLTRINLL
jgi:hypothetical protein